MSGYSGKCRICGTNHVAPGYDLCLKCKSDLVHTPGCDNFFEKQKESMKVPWCKEKGRIYTKDGWKCRSCGKRGSKYEKKMGKGDNLKSCG